MKRFSVKLISFLFPVLMVIIFIEYSLSRIPNSYNKKKSFLDKQLDSLEVIITGNSQALFGINPAYLSKKAFNISNVSQELYYDSALILNYRSKIKNLKTVIIALTYTSLYVVPLERSSENWRCYYYNRFWQIPNRNIPFLNPENFSFIALYSWEETMKLMVKRFKVDLAENLERNGFMRMDTVNNALNISDSLGRSRVLSNESIMNDRNFSENYIPLVKLIKQLRKDKIEVVLITMPVYSTYYKYCNPYFLQRNDVILRKLAVAYGLKYVDYLKDRRFGKEDFLDNDHLNYTGASHFSHIIDSEIIKNN